MGFKHDQRLPSEIHQEYVAEQEAAADEPLPPYSAVAAGGSSSNAGPDHPYAPSSSDTLYLASPDTDSDPFSSPPIAPSSLALFPPGLSANDPRSTSQESITPSEPSPSDGRRILLLVYIHGFVGNETSFGSFPAHVHSLLTERVAATHVVHTKIYPRYKTRRNITVVRDQFSAWLTPREGARTDIILVGHSMGGILAAEVALMPGGTVTNPGGLKHRLLGTLNLDVPFLGMHPKIIGAGLSSLFAGAPEKKAKPMPYLSGEGAASTSTMATGMTSVGSIDSVTTASTTSLTPASSLSPAFSGSSGHLQMPVHNDQYFNPAYTNDSRVPTRTAFNNLSHFVSKHAMSDGLLKAGTNYVSSHLEFGGTMADYRKLDRRYKHLRALEKEEWGGVHFINYFTTCEGRPKPVKAKKPAKTKKKPVDGGSKKAESNEEKAGAADVDSTNEPDASPPSNDHIDADEEAEDENEDEEESPSGGMEQLTLTMSDPVPVSDTESEDHHTPSSDGSFRDAQDFIDEEQKDGEETAGQTEDKEDDLPPIPPAPVPPAAFDASKYTEKDALKMAEKMHSRQLKAYQQAFKDREKVVREREKLIKKREDKKRKDEEKALKESLKQAKVQSKESAKEEQRKRAEEKNAEKEQQRKLKQLEKEAIREKKEAEKAEKARLKEEKKKEREKEATAAQAQADGGGSDDDDGEDGEEEGEEGEAAPTILKKRKLRTFCMTPPKATAARRKDWIPVFVADVDQVGAHCGLFRADQPHYEPFVERVVERIEDWADDVGGAIEL